MKKRITTFSVVLGILLANAPVVIADVIPKNPQLLSATASALTVKRGEVFTMTISVNAFDGYIFSAGGSFYSTFGPPTQNTSFECRGYMPNEGDSSKVLAVQQGEITLKCVVPRNSLEGKYRLYYFDLSSVGCKKTHVMEFANPTGVSCPSSWTHYGYRGGGLSEPSDPYATENQITSLNYPVDVFTSFPVISVKDLLPLEVPEIELVKSYPDRISAKYYFGSGWERDMPSLCAIETDLGLLATTVILSGEALPLNGAAQPSYYQIVNINIQDLKPKSSIELKISCKDSAGGISSRNFKFQTILPSPPATPITRVTSITDQSAVLEIQSPLYDDTKYQYILNDIIFDLDESRILVGPLKENSYNKIRVTATDLYGQNSTSTTIVFRTNRTLQTIACVKGKIIKKVTGYKPRCPSGYQKR